MDKIRNEVAQYLTVFKLQGARMVLSFAVFVFAYYVAVAAYAFIGSNYPANWPGNRVSEHQKVVMLLDQDGDPETMNVYKTGEFPIGVFTVVRHKFVEVDIVHRLWCSNGYRSASEHHVPLTNTTLTDQPIKFGTPVADGQEGVCYDTYDSTQQYTFLGKDRTYNVHYETELYLVEQSQR